MTDTPTAADLGPDWMERGTDEYSRTIMAMGAINMALSRDMPGGQIHVAPIFGPDKQVINQFEVWFTDGVLADLCRGVFRLTIEQRNPADFDDGEPF